MDIGLIIIRAVVGLTLMGHGAQILFGSFHGPGLTNTGISFANLGYRPGKFFAVINGAIQFGAGGCFVLGLLTPVAGAAIIASMLSAALSVHIRNGFWITDQGCEYTLVLGAIGAGLAFTGAGAISVDHTLGLSLGGNAWGAFALAVGLVAGLLMELYRRRQLALVQPPPPASIDRTEKRAA